MANTEILEVTTRVHEENKRLTAAVKSLEENPADASTVMLIEEISNLLQEIERVIALVDSLAAEEK